ncbi:hypothetical protein SAMN05443252_102537 [Bacillus sp. OV322]|uniref:hypothetical protein n=1 Tax=Bacillus sp. OV322 TaxID=1882764 RepID=UPI0008E15BBB|nr:hypothetical protein [Bacillus sp. OV322]SFC28036.1 hypothetical protein SAMN05443252_102537 [Bacillus sp. OV322]
MQQQNENQNQQGASAQIMQQPPQILSSKDAMYLTDMLTWNLLAVKKARFFAEQSQNPKVVQALNQCGQMHQRHYETILSHLNKGQQSSGNQLQ